MRTGDQSPRGAGWSCLQLTKCFLAGFRAVAAGRSNSSTGASRALLHADGEDCGASTACPLLERNEQTCEIAGSEASEASGGATGGKGEEALAASSTTTAAPTSASEEEESDDEEEDSGGRLRALQAESRLLRWEASRLARERRGLRVLLAVLRKQSVQTERSEETAGGESAVAAAAAAAEAEDAAALRASARRLRRENGRLAQELADLERQVADLRGVGGAGRGGHTVVKGEVRRMPPDGSCLFHSLSFGLAGAVSAATLRQEIADFVEANPTVVVAGQPLRDWVAWESDEDIDTDEYAAAMRRGHEWGGAIEMAVCSHLRAVSVRVFERAGGGDFRLMCAFEAPGPGDHPSVNVVFRPGHYDALEIALS